MALRDTVCCGRSRIRGDIVKRWARSLRPGIIQPAIGRLCGGPAMTPSHRLGYVDWARGLAVYVMIQTHTYSSWLSPSAKQTRFWHRVELLGGYGAPLFLFLAGMGLALKAERLLAAGRP